MASSRYRLMAAWRSTTDRNTPRFKRRLVKAAKKVSTALSQEHEVGVKMVWAGGEGMAPSALSSNRMECPMPKSNDLSRSLTAFDQESTLIVVIEMSQSGWLVAGLVPGIERQPLKKLCPDEDGLLKLVHRWRDEAIQAGREIKRGTDGQRPIAWTRSC